MQFAIRQLSAHTAYFFATLLSFPERGVAALFPADTDMCKFSTGEIRSHCIPIFLAHLIKFILGFVGAFCLINIIIGGYQIALGSAIGDKEAGKSRIMWALVGLLVTLLSYGIINLIITTLGL